MKAADIVNEINRIQNRKIKKIGDYYLIHKKDTHQIDQIKNQKRGSRSQLK